MFNIILQYLEKYSSTVQQLAYRGWHRVNRQEIKVLYYCTLYSTVKYTKAQPLVEDAQT